MEPEDILQGGEAGFIFGRKNEGPENGNGGRADV